jgi:hypothetical protein
MQCPHPPPPRPRLALLLLVPLPCRESSPPTSSPQNLAREWAHAIPWLRSRLPAARGPAPAPATHSATATEQPTSKLAPPRHERPSPTLPVVRTPFPSTVASAPPRLPHAMAGVPCPVSPPTSRSPLICPARRFAPHPTPRCPRARRRFCLPDLPAAPHFFFAKSRSQPRPSYPQSTSKSRRHGQCRCRGGGRARSGGDALVGRAHGEGGGWEAHDEGWHRLKRAQLCTDCSLEKRRFLHADAPSSSSLARDKDRSPSACAAAALAWACGPPRSNGKNPTLSLGDDDKAIASGSSSSSSSARALPATYGAWFTSW